VPPLAMKFDAAPPLTPLLGDANTAFERSDLIVVVGFSFADADAYISRMIGKAMQTSSEKRVVVVDPDHLVTDRVRRKFRSSIPNFDVNRIIRVALDCDQSLPAWLSGELFQPVLVEDKPKAGKVAGHGRTAGAGRSNKRLNPTAVDPGKPAAG